MGEAAGVVVLQGLGREGGGEDLRNLLDCGLSSDARHATEPDPTRATARPRVRMAMADAGVNADEIGIAPTEPAARRRGERG